MNDDRCWADAGHRRAFRKNVAVLSVLAVVAVACGGGGGSSSGVSGVGSGPVASTSTFPFATAFANLVNNGFSRNVTVTGTVGVNGTGISVAGTGTIVATAATATTFENQSALTSTTTATANVTANGTSLPQITTTTQSYYTSNYVPLGEASANSYLVMQGTPTLPATVKVGDTAVIGTFTRYSSSSKLTTKGTAQISYVVEADTATTAILNLIEKDYDQASTLTLTDQSRWRLDTSGNVTWVSDTGTDATTNPATTLLFK